MFKSIKRLFSISMFGSILFLAFGLLLFFKPEGTINFISSIIGLILLIMGFISVVKYLRDSDRYSNFDLIYGIVSAIAGIVLLVNPNAVASILPFVLGIYFIINGIFKLKSVMYYKNNNGYLPIYTLIISILIIICGILFVINPFGGALAITKVIGLFLSIYAILDIINFILLKKNIKEIKSVIKD